VTRASLLALALVCACTGGQAVPAAGGPAKSGKRKQKRPGVDEWFTRAPGRPPVDLGGTAAAGLAFTELKRGRFSVWHARAIPGRRADAVWTAVRGRGRDLVPLLVRDEVFDEGVHGQLVSAAGVVDRGGTLALRQALVLREKHLGQQAVRMRVALLTARPNESYQHSIDIADRLFQKLWADPESRPYDVALSVYRGPIEDVAPFLVSGAGFEPGAAELAAALRDWRDKYGAVPRRWERGRGLELAVERPPRTLAEQRELAWQFYLVCPGPPGGPSRSNEPADQLLVRIAQNRWDCVWYAE
jgi:hypothetical protein